jgi:tetratricopeptide (TPR) repeat protein
MLRISTSQKIQSERLSLATALFALMVMMYCCPRSFAQAQPGQPQPNQQPNQQPGQQPAPPGTAPAADPSQESSSKKELPPDSPEESSSKKEPIPDSPEDAAASKKQPVADTPDGQPKPKSKGAKPGVLPPEDDPAWDPFHAQQDIEVGEFYLHKGDLDAAITRFEDAVRLRANFAKPRLLLAETYEKKGDKAEALRYYKEYLEVLPNPPDAKKIHQKIEKLSENK